jgi:hypothetical protein
MKNNKFILLTLTLMLLAIILLSFMVIHLTYEVRTYKTTASIQSKRAEQLRKDLLLCGESVRQGNELLDGHTLLMKLNK